MRKTRREIFMKSHEIVKNELISLNIGVKDINSLPEDLREDFNKNVNALSSFFDKTQQILTEKEGTKQNA